MSCGYYKTREKKKSRVENRSAISRSAPLQAVMNLKIHLLQRQHPFKITRAGSKRLKRLIFHLINISIANVLGRPLSNGHIFKEFF